MVPSVLSFERPYGRGDPSIGDRGRLTSLAVDARGWRVGAGAVWGVRRVFGGPPAIGGSIAVVVDGDDIRVLVRGGDRVAHRAEERGDGGDMRQRIADERPTSWWRMIWPPLPSRELGELVFCFKGNLYVLDLDDPARSRWTSGDEDGLAFLAVSEDDTDLVLEEAF